MPSQLMHGLTEGKEVTSQTIIKKQLLFHNLE
jgi:hypothetical protein